MSGCLVSFTNPVVAEHCQGASRYVALHLLFRKGRHLIVDTHRAIRVKWDGTEVNDEVTEFLLYSHLCLFLQTVLRLQGKKVSE